MAAEPKVHLRGQECSAIKTAKVLWRSWTLHTTTNPMKVTCARCRKLLLSEGKQ